MQFCLSSPRRMVVCVILAAGSKDGSKKKKKPTKKNTQKNDGGDGSTNPRGIGDTNNKANRFELSTAKKNSIVRRF